MTVTNILEFEVFENFIFYPPANKVMEGNVFQSCASISLPTSGGSHVTITYGALDLTVQGPSPSTPLCTGPVPVQIPGITPFTGPQPFPPLMLVTSGSQDWKPDKTCSLEDSLYRDPHRC